MGSSSAEAVVGVAHRAAGSVVVVVDPGKRKEPWSFFPLRKAVSSLFHEEALLALSSCFFHPAFLASELVDVLSWFVARRRGACD